LALADIDADLNGGDDPGTGYTGGKNWTVYTSSKSKTKTVTVK